MTVETLEGIIALRKVSSGEESRDISGVYCGDLLSMVMGHALEGQVWITVMGNLNAIAVASLTDVSAVILAEGSQLDEAAQKRAESEGIWVFTTELTIYETAMLVSENTSKGILNAL